MRANYTRSPFDTQRNVKPRLEFPPVYIFEFDEDVLDFFGLGRFWFTNNYDVRNSCVHQRLHLKFTCIEALGLSSSASSAVVRYLQFRWCSF